MKRNFILPCLAGILIMGVVAFAYFDRANIAVLHPQGPVSLGELQVMGITVLLSAIVVVPLFILLFLFAWKYRAGNPKMHIEHKPNWDHDNYFVEFLWWLVPTAIVLYLGLVAWHSSHEYDPYQPILSNNAPITIDVVALDWKWLFIYPQQGIATVNMIEVPVNTPVHFQLTADAPMNSFWVPNLGGQIMVMPGMQTQLNLMATNAGTYSGLSGNMSGKGFAGMKFSVKVVSQDDFSSWVQSVQQHSNSLTQSAYRELALPSENNPVATYAPIDLNLYNSIIMNYMTPKMQMQDSVSTSSK
jgi:cytochrome o ubiquinol oxidase subunit 2